MLQFVAAAIAICVSEAFPRQAFAENPCRGLSENSPDENRPRDVAALNALVERAGDLVKSEFPGVQFTPHLESIMPERWIDQAVMHDPASKQRIEVGEFKYRIQNANVEGISVFLQAENQRRGLVRYFVGRMLAAHPNTVQVTADLLDDNQVAYKLGGILATPFYTCLLWILSRY